MAPSRGSPSALRRQLHRLAEAWARLNASNNALFVLGERNRLRRVVIRITSHKYYDKVVLTLILVNCAFLAMFDPRLDEDHPWNGVLDLSELIFTVAFTVEFVLQIVAKNFVFGRDAYLKNPWNWLDFVIVVAGLMSLAKVGGNLTGLRTFRALKPLKTINGVPGMRMLVTTLLESIPMIGDVFLLVAWLFLIFGIIGVSEFHGSMRDRCYHDNRIDAGGNALLVHAKRNVPCAYRGCDEQQTCKPFGKNPNFGFTSFDDMAGASLTIFQVMTLQGWSTYVFDPVVAGNGPMAATVFFVNLVAFGGIFATALLTSVVTAKYIQLSKIEAFKGVTEDTKSAQALFDRLMRYSLLRLFYELDTRERAWQKRLQAIVTSNAMENLILACIMANVVVMAADYPGMDPDVAYIFTWLNFGFSVVFAGEFTLKLPAFGIIRFCQDTFNLLDALVVILWVVEIALTAGPFGDGGSSQFSGLRTFRLLRVIRSMKALRSNRGLKKLMETIFHGISALGSFMAVLTMFIFIFTLLGMQLFGGPDDDVSLERRNFNTLFNSFVSVFEMLTGTNWYLLLWSGMRSKGSVLGIYFVFWIILGNFVLLKLFFAIVVNNFQQETDEERENREKAERERLEYMKSMQHSEIVQERITRRRYNRLAREVNRLRTWLRDVDMYDEVGPEADVEDEEVPLAPGEMRDSDDDADDGQVAMLDLPFSAGKESLKTKRVIPTVVVHGSDKHGVDRSPDRTARSSRFGPWKVTDAGPVTEAYARSAGPVVEAFQGTGDGRGGGRNEGGGGTTHEAQSDRVDASGAPVPRNRPEWQRLQQRVHMQLRDDAGRGGVAFGSQARAGSAGPPAQDRPTVSAAARAKMLVAKLLNPDEDEAAGAAAMTREAARERQEREEAARHVERGEVPTLGKFLKSKDVLKTLVDQTKDEEGRKHLPLSPSSTFAAAVQQQVSSKSLLGRGEAATGFQKVVRTFKQNIRDRRKEHQELRPIVEDSNLLGMEPNDLVIPPTLATARAKVLERGVPVDTVYISVEPWMWTRKVREKEEIITLEAKPDTPAFLEYRSLFLFPPTSTLRRVLYLVVSDQYFEWMIITVIFLSSIALAVDKPTLRPDDPVKRVVDLSDVAFNIIFFFEFLLKVIAMGLVMHPGAYLRGAWNALDFLIMLTSTVSMATNSPELKIFRSFRLLRSLRPLRMIRRLRGMQVVVVALIRSMPTTVNVLTFGSFLFFIFGVLGVQMFGLTFYSCNDASVSGKEACVGDYVPVNATSAADVFGFLLSPPPPPPSPPPFPPVPAPPDFLGGGLVVATPPPSPNASDAVVGALTTAASTALTTAAGSQKIARLWKNRAYNFDNLWNAMVALFVVATMDNWLNIAFDAVDATGIDKQPSKNSQPAVFLYFVAWVVLGSLFFFNLLVGVVVDNYLRIQAETGELVLRTQEQKHWAEAIKTKKYQAEMARAEDLPDNFVQRFMYRILYSSRFDVFIMVCIVLNVIVMASFHDGQSVFFTDMQEALGFIFALLFLFEAVLKLLASGPTRYWADEWNRFDAFIVVASLPGLLGLDLGVGLTVFRIFRVGRLFKILKGARGLRALFNTFLDALPALANVGSLLFLLMFTYAVLGMNLFYALPMGGAITANYNFRDFPSSLLVLFRVFTKDSWSTLMEACYDCAATASDCGVQVTAPLYFISFIILASYTMLYLVIATMIFYFGENAINENLLSATSFFDALQRKLVLDKFMSKLTKKVMRHTKKQAKLGRRAG